MLLFEMHNHNGTFFIVHFRWRKGDRVFLVAVYECDEEYDLLVPSENRLYCSGRKWIGTEPKCISKNGGNSKIFRTNYAARE